MALADSTKRTIRTAIQVVLALGTALPTYLAGADYAVLAGQVTVVAAAISKVWGLLEEVGILPPWLRTAVPADSVFNQPAQPLADPAAPTPVVVDPPAVPAPVVVVPDPAI
jgi:hypothetical protein